MLSLFSPSHRRALRIHLYSYPFFSFQRHISPTGVGQFNYEVKHVLDKDLSEKCALRKKARTTASGSDSKDHADAALLKPLQVSFQMFTKRNVHFSNLYVINLYPASKLSIVLCIIYPDPRTTDQSFSMTIFCLLNFLAYFGYLIFFCCIALGTPMAFEALTGEIIVRQHSKNIF